VDSVAVNWLGTSELQTIYTIPSNRRILITQADDAFTTNTNEILKETGIKLFPNPSKDQLFVDFTGFDKTQSTINLSVLTITGKEIIARQLAKVGY